MLDIIFSIFSAIYNGIVSILNLIVSIPRYTTAVIAVITSVLPIEVLALIMVGVTAYIIIHIKRLVI